MLITAKSKLVFFMAGMIMLSLSVSPAHAENPKIIHVAGKAELLEAKSEAPIQATVGAQLKPGSKIVVFGKGTVEIKVGKESINATAGDDTQLEYKGRSFFKGVERFTLQKGRALFKIKKGDKLDVKTPHVVASVRGTEFLARADEKRSSISVISGSVHTRDQRGNNLELNSDSYAVIDKQGFVEVGKGLHGPGITGKVRTEKGTKVEAANKSGPGRRAGAVKSEPAKGRKDKIKSEKGPSGKSSASSSGIGKSKAEKSGSGKGNAGGKGAGGENAGRGSSGGGSAGGGSSGGGSSSGGSSGSGNAGGGSSGGGNAGGGSSGGGNAGGGGSGGGNAGGGDSGGGNAGGGNAGGGNSDSGNAGDGKSDKGNSGKGNSGKGNSGKGNPGKGNSKK
jgi:hypothetical protein